MRMRTVEISVGAFVLAGALALTFLAVKVSGVTLTQGDGTYVVKARFDDVAGLRPRSKVSMAGVTIGREAVEKSVRVQNPEPLEPGTYTVVFGYEEGGKMRTAVTGVSVPYSPEYRRLDADVEMLRQSGDDLDVVIVPVGGGSLAAGTVTVIKALSPRTTVIAVQAENAPAFHDAWHSKSLAPTVAAMTVADGLATRVPVRYTLEMMQELDDFVLVSEDQICSAIRCYADTIHQLAEGAGAAPLAAALAMRDRLSGKRVGLILTGSNIDNATLRQALRADAPVHTPHAVPHFPMASLDYGD